MSKKTKYLVLGKSGSGKSTLVNEICSKYNYKAIDSYTTRPPRYNNEKGHVFTNENTYLKHKQNNTVCGFTEFNGYKYWATFEQLEEADFYIIDKKGIDFLKSINNNGYKLVVLYITIPIYKRLWRLYKRDGLKKTVSRFINDIKMFRSLEYDYKIKNNKIDNSINSILDIVKSY